jgi:hypothetical protein
VERILTSRTSDRQLMEIRRLFESDSLDKTRVRDSLMLVQKSQSAMIGS